MLIAVLTAYRSVVLYSSLNQHSPQHHPSVRFHDAPPRPDGLARSVFCVHCRGIFAPAAVGPRTTGVPLLQPTGRGHYRLFGRRKCVLVLCYIYARGRRRRLCCTDEEDFLVPLAGLRTKSPRPGPTVLDKDVFLTVVDSIFPTSSSSRPSSTR